jgi:excisionase family DNA binding protein
MVDKLISAPSAVISGGAAWLINRVLSSPDVTRVLESPPSWIERGDIADALTAIDQAAKAFAASQPAPRRGKTATLGAAVADSAGNWTTAEAAEYLRISVRRTQELAPELGGVRIGRQWLIPAVAARLYAERRDAA